MKKKLAYDLSTIREDLTEFHQRIHGAKFCAGRLIGTPIKEYFGKMQESELAEWYLAIVPISKVLISFLK
jgi:hypothetical protein